MDKSLTGRNLKHQASINHKKAAELFSEALGDIAEDLQTTHKSVRISDSMKMTFLVVDLCISIFDFLIAAMDWYESKLVRFKAAFNQKYSADIKQLDMVNKAVSRIRLEAKQATEDRVQNTQQRMRKVGQEIDHIKERLDAAGKETRDSDMDDVKDRLAKMKLMLVELGKTTQQVLYATGQAARHSQCFSLSSFFDR